MEIVVENCNSIDRAVISLELGRLNIKYGANGTGKSTIAKAIECSIKGSGFGSLIPFKYRSAEPGLAPVSHVSGVDGFGSVLVFNEDYVNQFVFRQDEVLKNSFDIFIKSADYESRMKGIEGLIFDIRKAFENNASILQVITDLLDLSASFGKSQSGYSKAGRIGKGVGAGNKLEHIPPGLAPYSSFIKSECNVKWIKWQVEGNDFLDISEECPYCTSPTDGKKDTILSVGKEYDAKSIEHLIALQGIISRLGKYFSDDVLGKISLIVKNKDGLKKEEIAYLTGLKGQVDTLREKLVDVRGISFFSLRDVDKVRQRILDLKIDLSLLGYLDSVDTRLIVGEVNESLELVLEKAGNLQGEINKQKHGVELAIVKYRTEINDFLRYAGYKYSVDMVSEADSYKMKLRHVDHGEDIENGAMHLSYGERNAFSIVLFMYECLTRSPDFVVLDDPISSFDKSKKFAIIEMLFRGKESLRDKTVLMLTHDIEPVVDMVKSLNRTFQPAPFASFLRSNSGEIVELAVTKDDISTFAQICRENIGSIDNGIIKAIYLRRHYEVVDDKGVEYQLLSNLLHKREVPVVLDGVVERPMTAPEIDCATLAIGEWLGGFAYGDYLANVSDDAAVISAYAIADNGYEKLQLYRVLNQDKHHNDVVRKYINEAFHIENESIMQLNPHKYDSVPEHIVLECDAVMVC